MRDLLLAGVFILLILQVYKRPYFGVLIMAWIGYMNPHRLAFGFAYNLQWAAIATVITFIALLVTKEREPLPTTALTKFWIAFIIWITITTLFAIYFDLAFNGYKTFIKIQIGILFTILLIRTPHQIKALLAVIVFSIAFYGIKGGFFTIVTGGSYRVWGPSGSFIEGNNELAVALLMTVPFIYFFFTEAKQKWLKYTLLCSIILVVASAVGSHSRGALLALASTSLFLWFHSKQKVSIAVVFLSSS